MRMIADDVRQFNLKKQALFQYKQFMLGRLQYLRLNDCAENYYRLGLIKTAID